MECLKASQNKSLKALDIKLPETIMIGFSL